MQKLNDLSRSLTALEPGSTLIAVIEMSLSSWLALPVLCADSEEKHEPVSDIDTAAADGLKVLDPKRPIREADIAERDHDVR